MLRDSLCLFELERWGGTAAQNIGDVVVLCFGACQVFVFAAGRSKLKSGQVHKQTVPAWNNTCQWLPTLSPCKAMSSVSQGPWTNERWLGLMFFKMLQWFLFLPLCTHKQTRTGRLWYDYHIDPDLRHSKSKWKEKKKDWFFASK